MPGHAMTVLGPVPVTELGFTLPHEHILFDTTAWLVEPKDERKREIAERPISIETFGELQRDPTISRENLRFFDEEVAARELRLFADAGGRTIVDVTPPEMGRDPEAMRRLSAATGVQVIAGTGHYLQSVHPPEVAQQTVDEVAEWMVGEIDGGIDGTDVRPGVIGEIGVSPEIHPDERKCLLAAALAQQATGLPISIHSPLPYVKKGLEILDILAEGGADLERVVMGHMSHTIEDLDYHRAVADRGAVLEYDRFGAEFTYESWGNYREPRDVEVVDAIVELVRSGYADHIVLSHDVCYRTQMAAFGGWGFAHVPVHITMYLRDRGVADTDILRMTIENPARIFEIKDA